MIGEIVGLFMHGRQEQQIMEEIRRLTIQAAPDRPHTNTFVEDLRRRQRDYAEREALLLAEIDERRAEVRDIRIAARAVKIALGEVSEAEIEQAAEETLADVVGEAVA